MSNQALAAKNIKQELKAAFPGIKFSVSSDSFSMGDSVAVRWNDGPTTKEVEAITNEYCNSEYDGTQDLSSYVTKAKHVYGSSKYVHASRSASELCKRVTEMLRPLIREEDHYKMLEHENLAWKIVSRVSLKAGQTITGVHHKPMEPGQTSRAGHCFSEFYEVELSGTEAPPAALCGSVAIQRTKHTQKGYDLFVIQLPARVSRETFMSLLQDAKALGGWYSSYSVGGAVPGFQFKSEAGAKAFLEVVEGQPMTQATPAKAEATHDQAKQRVERLRTLADGMEEAIDGKLNSATSQQNPTPRRLRIAEHMRQEGRRLQQTQAALRRIADAIEAKEELPFEFLSLSWSKSVVSEALNGRGLPALVNWLKSVPKVQEDPTKKRIRELEESFVGQKMPGFFPTPPELVSRMLDHVDLRAGTLVLEPSAGSGNIAAAINHGSVVHCCEIRPSLAELLKLKGQRVVAGDFFEYQPGPIYDVVLMNPPFETKQAVSHIFHAWECLKSGGRLVAIAPESIMFNADADYKELREWIESTGAEVEDIEAGAFEKSGTNVKTRMLIATK